MIFSGATQRKFRLGIVVGGVGVGGVVGGVSGMIGNDIFVLIVCFVLLSCICLFLVQFLCHFWCFLLVFFLCCFYVVVVIFFYCLDVGFIVFIVNVCFASYLSC